MITRQNSSLEKLIQSMPVNTMEITKRQGGYIFISNVFHMHLYVNPAEPYFENRLQMYFELKQMDSSLLQSLLDFAMSAATANKLKGVRVVDPLDSAIRRYLKRRRFQEVTDPFYLDAIRETKPSNIGVVMDLVIDL